MQNKGLRDLRADMAALGTPRRAGAADPLREIHGALAKLVDKGVAPVTLGAINELMLLIRALLALDGAVSPALLEHVRSRALDLGIDPRNFNRDRER